MDFLLKLLVIGLIFAGIAVLIHIIQYLLPILVCGGVIAGIVCGIVYLWNISTSISAFFSTLFYILGILLGAGILIYVIYIISAFIGGLFDSDNSNSTKSEKNQDYTKYGEAGMGDLWANRYCFNCRYYSNGICHNSEMRVSAVNTYDKCKYFEQKKT